MLPSVCSASLFFNKEMQRGLWPELIPDLQGISATSELPRRLLSWFQVTPPCGLAALLLTCSVLGDTEENMLFYHSSVFVRLMCCLVCRAAELWSAGGVENKEGPGSIWTSQPVLCAGELPRAFEGCPENWCQMRVTWEVGQVYEICIEVYSSFSENVFLSSGDWWIDLNSQTGTNCTAPGGKPHPAGHPCAKSTRHSQNENSEAYKFAVFSPSDQAVLFAILELRLCLRSAALLPVRAALGMLTKRQRVLRM